MKVFVTGGSGYIGTQVIPVLLAAGHEVGALARSSELAAKLKALDAEIQVIQGGLEDLDVLEKSAREYDGVIHLAFIHDFANFETSLEVDLAAIKAIGGALKGSNKPFVGTGGMAAISGKSGIAIESDRSEDELRPRVALEIALLSLKDEGVRSLLIRLPFTVHGEGRFGFVPFYVDKSKKLEFAGYVDDGSNHWPAVNVEDAAELYKLVLEKGKAGSVYHGVAEEGIPFNQIAAQTAEGLNVPTKSLLTEEAVQDYQWLARFLSMGVQASSEITQKELGWKPTHGTLFDDIKNHYVE